MFKRMARLVTGHPWPVIGAWMVLIGLVLALSPQLARFTSNNNSEFLPGSYQSVQALNLTQRYFPAAAQASGIIVVHSADNATLTSSDFSKVTGLAQYLTARKIPALESATTNQDLVSADKKVQLVQIVFRGQPGASGPNAAVAQVREDTSAFLAGSGLTAGLTGSAAISVDSTNAYNGAEKVITIATVVLILLLLGLVFRSVVIAVMPIVIIGAVHQLAQSLTADLADLFHFEVGSVLAPLLIVVMFGIGTDYIVFLLFRYRERLAAGDNTGEALRTSVSAVAVVIASAAATVAAAFAALLVSSLQSLKTLAPGLIVGVLCMLLAALTLVPACCSLLGRTLFWPSAGPGAATGPAGRPSFAERLGARVARRPGVILAGFAVVLGVLAAGSLGYQATYNQLGELPGSTPSLVAFNEMASAFPPGALGATQVVVSARAPLTSTQLSSLTARLKSVSGVAAVLPPQLSADQDAALISVYLSADPYSTTAMDTVAGPVRAAAHGAIPGAQVLVGGTTAQLVDVRTALKHDTRLVFPLALAIIAVILGLLLRAAVAPLWLLAGVSLSYGAAVGATVLIFQQGLGYSGLDFTTPIVLYLFVVAIGTDYNILMAHRLKEEFDTGAAPREAARRAIARGAPAVTAAGLILAGTFLSLLLTGIQNLEEIGLGVALGVIIAAYVLSTRLVPTIGALRGWQFWWPQRRQRHLEPSAAMLAADAEPTGEDGQPEPSRV